MATLREAVESGRWWKHRGWVHERSLRGTKSSSGVTVHLTVEEALSSDFEIESLPPEPEKPREWRIHLDSDVLHEYAPTCPERGVHVRVHDADACDRLNQPPLRCRAKDCVNTASRAMCQKHAQEWIVATFKKLLARLPEE